MQGHKKIEGHGLLPMPNDMSHLLVSFFNKPTLSIKTCIFLENYQLLHLPWHVVGEEVKRPWPIAHVVCMDWDQTWLSIVVTSTIVTLKHLATWRVSWALSSTYWNKHSTKTQPTRSDQCMVVILEHIINEAMVALLHIPTLGNLDAISGKSCPNVLLSSHL